MSTVLIIDDDDDICFTLKNIVKKQGYDTAIAESGAKGIELLRTTITDIVLLDIGLPDISGLELIKNIRDTSPDTDIIVLTGMNDAKTAVDAIKNGAIDYLVKPFELIEFRNTLNRVMQARLMAKKAAQAGQSVDNAPMIGSSNVMRAVFEQITIASEVPSPVLITGQTGTGKEITARAIHNSSQQHDQGVFVKVDCGTLSSNLIESELFGYKKGAFTDAQQSKKGLVEIAHGGTLFLDEIGNLPIDVQPKFLRLIEDGIFRRVGGLTDKKVQIRVIAATNISMQEEIIRGTFREDLFYRLNVIPITLPPLCKRDKDITELAEFFLHTLKADLKKDIHGFTPEAQKALLNHSWPGNIRELKNFIEREVIFCRDKWLALPSLTKTETLPTATGSYDFPLPLREMEKHYIEDVLQHTSGNKSEAARILGISRTTLRDKIN